MGVHTFGKFTCEMTFIREKYGMARWDYEFKLGDEVVAGGIDRSTVAFDEKEAIMEILKEDSILSNEYEIVDEEELRKEEKDKVNKSTKKLIGRVGVDSGQLMIIDPCYIDGEWEKDGEVIGLKFWGQGQDDVANILRNHYDVEEDSGTYRISSSNVDYLRGIQKEIKETADKVGKIVVTTPVTNSSYDKVCDLTMSDNKAGSLHYKLGHEGLAVAFSSGFGDGAYDVYATYKDFGQLGTRITKVEIELIDEDEDEDDNKLKRVIENN